MQKFLHTVRCALLASVLQTTLSHNIIFLSLYFRHILTVVSISHINDCLILSKAKRMVEEQNLQVKEKNELYFHVAHHLNLAMSHHKSLIKHSKPCLTYSVVYI